MATEARAIGVGSKGPSQSRAPDASLPTEPTAQTMPARHSLAEHPLVASQSSSQELGKGSPEKEATHFTDSRVFSSPPLPFRVLSLQRPDTDRQILNQGVALGLCWDKEGMGS